MKMVVDVKFKVLQYIYEEYDSKSGEKTLFKLDKMRDRRIKDLDYLRCVKNEDC